MATVLKTVDPKGSVSSNLTASANIADMETWPSGRRQQVANLSYVATGTVSSNLTVSTRTFRVSPDSVTHTMRSSVTTTGGSL